MKIYMMLERKHVSRRHLQYILVDARLGCSNRFAR